jgi:hypothetical protein
MPLQMFGERRRIDYKADSLGKKLNCGEMGHDWADMKREKWDERAMELQLCLINILPKYGLWLQMPVATSTAQNEGQRIDVPIRVCPIRFESLDNFLLLPNLRGSFEEPFKHF